MMLGALSVQYGLFSLLIWTSSNSSREVLLESLVTCPGTRLGSFSVVETRPETWLEILLQTRLEAWLETRLETRLTALFFSSPFDKSNELGTGWSFDALQPANSSLISNW